MIARIPLTSYTTHLEAALVLTWSEVIVCFSVFGTALSVQVALKMVKDDKAVNAVFGQTTIECNHLLVSIAKSKLPRQYNGNNKKATKTKELALLYYLLLQVII